MVSIFEGLKYHNTLLRIQIRDPVPFRPTLDPESGMETFGSGIQDKHPRIRSIGANGRLKPVSVFSCLLMVCVDCVENFLDFSGVPTDVR
jgi:hypothetical protein